MLEFNNMLYQKSVNILIPPKDRIDLNMVYFHLRPFWIQTLHIEDPLGLRER